MILKTPISAVERTCVPPHSSRDHCPSPISTIRTTSPYFSPNSAIAPSARASSSVVVSARTGSLARICSLTRSSTQARSSSDSGRAVREVEAQLVRADVGAGLAHVAAEARAQRRVQQVRRGVVGLRRAARGRVDRRHDALALVQLAPDGLEHERLVVAEADHVDHARRAAAVLALDLAHVGDLAAARGVERRLDELGEHLAVLEGDRADRGRLLGRLVARELRGEARAARRTPRSPRARRRRPPRARPRSAPATAPPPSRARSPPRRRPCPARPPAPRSARTGSRRCRAAGTPPRRRCPPARGPSRARCARRAAACPARSCA